MCVYIKKVCVYTCIHINGYMSIYKHIDILYSASKIQTQFPLCHSDSYTTEHGGKCLLKKRKVSGNLAQKINK